LEPATRRKRLNLLTIPLDIVTDEQLEDRVEAMLGDGKKHHIVLLSLMDFLRARGKSDIAKASRSASLILTSSKMVVFGAKFLRHQELSRYMPFDFVIRVLSILEKRGRSVYLIGTRPGYLQTASSNLRGSFPGLQIVGRCAGYFPTSHEENILLAIKKASPSLLLAGKGLPGKERWLLSHKKHFATGLTLWCGDCLDVFAGKKHKTSRELWTKGLDFIPDLLRQPWRIFLGFPYLWYLFLLIVYRLRKL
jgi:N-acetylglucosaminyldiphosphoundecaprenol N-acetyl-beta-D-mannosaminyltransferase